jgi:CheY-like chemotaxis protein
MQNDMTPMTGKNILIVDDDSFLLDMYSLKFAQKGFEVTTAPGTMEALEKLRGGLRADIIVVDLVMPAMDGFEFLDHVRTEGLAEGAMVIVLSNLSDQTDIDRALAQGAKGYIVKASATPTEVVDRVLETVAD